jgi:hypothetical protein
LEEEVANYHLNNIKNGMSPSMLINFNNGVPTEEERYMIESRIGEKFSGTSNAGKFILAFNDNKEMSATIEPVQLSDASDQYQFLADEAMRKLMVAHRVTSPMLLGIKDQSGLGNNAEELKTASTLFDNTIIRPFQEMILDGVDKILAFNDISLNLYFKTLQPLEFQEDVVVDQETQEEETGVKLSSQEPTDEYLDSAFNELEALGEVIDESEWELVEEAPVDYDAEAQMEKFFAFASTGTAFPNAKSTQDGVTPFGRPYKVRYGYAPEQAGSNSREFCKKMVSAKKVYRKEDILEMGNKAVNAGFGKGGAATYDIWLYKGGARCHHFWMRKVFMAKEGSADVDAKSPNAETGVANAKRAGAKIQTNPRDVSTKPKDMDYSGFTPEYAQQHGIPK